MKEFQVFTKPMFYMLLILHSPNHGYDIMQKVKEMTNDKVHIGPGTLYALLGQFEKYGYIKLVKKEDRKKIYQITKEGKHLFEKEVAEMEIMLEQARRVGGE